jgi:hypothetical protein
MFDQDQTSRVRVSRPLIRRRGVITVLFWIMVAATTTMAQQSAETVTETITTRRDLNGKDIVSAKVVTHRARTDGEERVVIETYLPSMEPDRLALSVRVSRVTTETHDWSRTVEETSERNQISPSEPLRLVQRTVTTVRRRGTDAYISERQVSERDASGRLVLVRQNTEDTPRR